MATKVLLHCFQVVLKTYINVGVTVLLRCRDNRPFLRPFSEAARPGKLTSTPGCDGA